MLDRDSQIEKDFDAWLALNNVLADWKKLLFPITLYHLEEDDIVTVSNTKLAAEELGIPAERVHYYSSKSAGMESFGDHSSFGKFFFSKVAEEIAAMLNPTSIESLDANDNVGPQKILEEGKLKIRIGGVSYDVMGRRLWVEECLNRKQRVLL